MSMKTTDSPLAGPAVCRVPWKSAALHRAVGGTGLALMLVVLWSLTHRYLGLDGDAKLYAFQALAHVHPSLTHDIFLQYVSQDRFTVFSALYARCIELLGLQHASMALTIVCKIWFLLAAWWLARAFSSPSIAFLATAALIIVPGRYGAYGVFQYAEDWLTARSLGEALIITGLALHFHGFRMQGLLIAVLALLVHPLMALPGVLLLMCLRTSARIGLLVAGAGILASLALALAALLMPSATPILTVMDARWLEVVHERSVYLFLQLWSVDDWKLNSKPFLALTMSALATNDPRIRQLCTAAMLVGAAGLVVALIASLLGPVALLLQGQAWRWVWISAFIAIVFLLPTALQAWRNGHCGFLCAVLLVCGWTLPEVDGVLCTGLALALWLIRRRIPAHFARYMRLAALVICAAVAIWVVSHVWTAAEAPQPVPDRAPFAITQFRKLMGVNVWALVLVGSLAYWIKRLRSTVLSAATAVVLAAACVALLPGAVKDVRQFGASTQKAEFADWRRAIPPDSNVFVVPSPTSASFAWFILERPNYLSADQSSGVVFSRAIEIEIRRRAELVLPLWDTNWRLRSRRFSGSAGSAESRASSRPLTRESLVAVCRDPQLNFVVAKENVSFDSIRHTRKGPWMDWYLYDCRKVNSASPSA